jgi:hypothetical protein
MTRSSWVLIACRIFGHAMGQSKELPLCRQEECATSRLILATIGVQVWVRIRCAESAARFLNLHARHGIDPGNLQMAAYCGYAPGDLLPQVTLAVSAMTVHVRLQEEGYRAVMF